MPEYLDPDVSALRVSDCDDEITLLLGVSGDRDESGARVRRLGAEVEATLGRATVRVTAPESAVDELCELEGLTSIECEREDVGILDEGNERSRRRVTRS